MKVLFVASEAAPFIKTGGLADVMGALPKALQALGVEPALVIPNYEGIGADYKNEMETLYARLQNRRSSAAITRSAASCARETVDRKRSDAVWRYE